MIASIDRTIIKKTKWGRGEKLLHWETKNTHNYEHLYLDKLNANKNTQICTHNTYDEP